MNHRQLIPGQKELVEKVINFFTSKAINPDLFDRIQKTGKINKAAEHWVPNFDNLFKLGHLTLWDFLGFENEYAQKKGISTSAVQAILGRMLEKGILISEPTIQGGGHRFYAANETLVKFLNDRDCLTNVIFGFSFISEKYQDSIFKIVIEDQAGDQHIGTGFLIAFPAVEKDISIVITNEHVVKSAKSLRVLRKTNESVQHNRVIKSQVSDLAAIELTELQKLPAFCLSVDPEILDEVISIGYPNVAMSRDSYQLTHRGEINSIIQDHKNETSILFSAKTAPGNSGGPLLNDFGLVVGVVSEDLFYRDALLEKGQLPYHAAIPASAITKFLENEYLIG